MADLKNVICSHCGKAMEIPTELEEFSCLYCGQHTKLHQQTKSKEAFAAAREKLRHRLSTPAVNYPDAVKALTKKEFYPRFNQYEQENMALFEELNTCALLHPDGVTVGARVLAGDMLEEISAHVEQGKSRREINKELFAIRVTLAIFLTPAIGKEGLAFGESFRRELHQQWKEKYPDQAWTPGDYEVLDGGFQKKRLCFITTATCRYEGKRDDCAELTAFRKFRDGWLTEHGGRELIKQYYDKAPGIVICIELCDNPKQRYREIRQRWLTPCYIALQEGKYIQCQQIYIDMVHTLQRYYEG